MFAALALAAATGIFVRGFRRDGDLGLLRGLQRIVGLGQIVLLEGVEARSDFVRFAFQRVDAGELIVGRFAVV